MGKQDTESLGGKSESAFYDCRLRTQREFEISQLINAADIRMVWNVVTEESMITDQGVKGMERFAIDQGVDLYVRGTDKLASSGGSRTLCVPRQ